MPSTWPFSTDTFTEPTLPEETSLSSAGTGTRNHVEHHRDLGDAIEAIQANATTITHDHSGAAGITHGPKLKQVNTHQLADTDTGLTAIHHTLGTGGGQAAAGNHKHDYELGSIIHRPIVLMGYGESYPSGGELRRGVVAIDASSLRWFQYDGSNWQELFTSTDEESSSSSQPANPHASLVQTHPQNISAGGTILEWSAEINVGNMWSSADAGTALVVDKPGTYNISCSVQWDPQIVPDNGFLVITKNQQDTNMRANAFLRGSGFHPGFSQSLSVGGSIYLARGDVIRAKVSYTAGGGLVGAVLTYFENIVSGGSDVSSRLEMTWQAA